MVQEKNLEDIARTFKQNLRNSCLVSSIMFSMALQHKDDSISDAVLDDMRAILNGEKSMFKLELSLEGSGEDYYQEKQDKLRAYMASGGHTIEMYHYSIGNLAGTINSYPLIYLLYPGQELFEVPTPAIISHVVTAVRLEGNDLVFFEPYGGIISKKSISLIKTSWSGIGVIKKL